MKSILVVGVFLVVGLAFFFLAPVYQVSYHNPPVCNSANAVIYCGAVVPPSIWKSLSCVVGIGAGVIYVTGPFPSPRYRLGDFLLYCPL